MNRIRIAGLLAALSIPAMAISQVVVIDADLGTGDDEQVQAALDAYPERTTFHLKGTFFFDAPIWMEKSNITIVGDYDDVNGDGRADVGDSWNTVIDGPFDFYDSIIIGGKDYSKSPKRIKNVTITGIDFKKIFGVSTSNYVIPDAPPSCAPEEYPSGYDRLLMEKNRSSGNGLRTILLLGDVRNSTVNDNLFLNQSVLGFPEDGIVISGTSRLEGCPQIFPYGNGNAITNNTLLHDAHFVTVAQENITIVGNTIIMGDLGVWPNSLAIILRGTRGGLVADNYIETVLPTVGLGIAVDSRVPATGWPLEYTERLHIRGNTIVNVGNPFITLGGLANSSISGNVIQGPGLFGIAVLDNADGLWGPGQQSHPSSNLTIMNNKIDDQIVAGVLLNGETSGVSVVNNAFGGEEPLMADYVLSATDMLWGYPVCPAHDNTIIATNFSTTLIDQYSECEGGPNDHLGVFNYLEKDLSDLPPDVQAKMEQLRQMKIDNGLGHPQ